MKRFVRFVLVLIFSGPSVLATKYAQTQGHRLWLSSITHEVVIFDKKTDKEIKRLRVGNFPLAIVIDEPLAYIVNAESNSVSILNLSTFQVEPKMIPVGRHPTAIALSNKKAYVTNGASDSVSIIDLESRTPQSTQIRVGLNPQDIQIIDDKAYVLNTYSNTVSCINLKTHQVQATLAVKLGPLGLVLDEGKGYIMNNLSHCLSIIDLKSLKVLDITIPLGKYPNGIICIDHRAYVLNCVSHCISVIDLRTQTALQSFPVSLFPDDFYVKDTHLITDSSDAIPLFPVVSHLKSTTLENLTQTYHALWPDMFHVDQPPPFESPVNPSGIERLHRLVQDELFELMPPLDALRTLISYKYPIRYLRSDSGKLIHRKLRLDFLGYVWLGKKEEAHAMLTLFLQLRDPLFVF